MERHYIRTSLFSLLDTKMGMPPNWFTKVTRKIRRSSSRDIVVLHSNSIKCEDEKNSGAAAGETVKYERINCKSTQCSTRELTKEDTSAVKIQSAFRAHLAQRAFRALRSLVKLQALVRGAYVRKQSRMASHCMHSLVRLQVRIRARQLLSRYGNDD